MSFEFSDYDYIVVLGAVIFALYFALSRRRLARQKEASENPEEQEAILKKELKYKSILLAILVLIGLYLVIWGK